MCDGMHTVWTDDVDADFALGNHRLAILVA